MNLKCLWLTMVILAGCKDRTESQPSTNIASAAARTETARPGASGKVVPPVKADVSACLVQGAQSIAAYRLRAVGTEPFWAARIEGRCVTYSHPDDQSGLRVWTRFSGSAEAGAWIGAYGAKPFVLRTRPQVGCSDGMSDRLYPIAVTLTVDGEQRQGCAEPL